MTTTNPISSASEKENWVLVRTTIYDIHGVDPVAQTFSMEVGLHMKWHSPALLGMNHEFNSGYFEIDVSTLSDNLQYKDRISIPTIYLENCIESTDVNNGKKRNLFS